MSKPAPKIDEIMSEIREKARAEAQANGSSMPRHQATVVKKDERPASSVLYSDELNFLNAHWHKLDSLQEVTSHRKLVGSLIVKVKRFFVNLIWNHALKDYFKKEREFNMNLVNFLNANARYIDSKNAESFWQLVEKVDNDVVALNDRMDVLFDELKSSYLQHKHDQEQEIAQLKVQIEKLQSELAKRS